VGVSQRISIVCGKINYSPEPPPVITATRPERSKRFLASMDAVSVGAIMLQE
jgi:hypothetical protein